MGVEPNKAFWRHPPPDQDDLGSSGGASGFLAQGTNIQIHMMRLKPLTREGGGDEPPEKRKPLTKEEAEQKIKEAPLQVTEETKRRYRKMMRAIIIIGKTAVEYENKTKEINAFILYGRAKEWMHMKRAQAKMARAAKFKREGFAILNDSMDCRELDFAAPEPNDELDATENAWLQTLENFIMDVS